MSILRVKLAQVATCICLLSNIADAQWTDPTDHDVLIVGGSLFAGPDDHADWVLHVKPLRK